jgi:hypothetical protein
MGLGIKNVGDLNNMKFRYKDDLWGSGISVATTF